MYACMPHLMWTDYMSRLVTQPYVYDSQPCTVVFPVPCAPYPVPCALYPVVV
jgi:hypothetical protein